MKKKYVLNGKVTVVLVAAVLLLSCAIGGTMAWLAAKTSEVKNTFTTSDIDITLAETKTDFKMVPGYTIDKDPKVTVTAGSEDCYLFVKIEESSNFKDYLKYKVNSSWKLVDGETNVYYQEVTDITTDNVFEILAGDTYTESGVTYKWDKNQVHVLPKVTKADMDKITKDPTIAPTLTFTAYAVQLYKNGSDKFAAKDAWAQAKALNTNTTPTT